MSLDAISLEMIDQHIARSAILCLGYPEHPDKVNVVRWLTERGAKAVDVVDVIAHFGMERIVNLNVEQVWPRRYDLIINPGTLEHCFNIGVAWANVWRALEVGGLVLHVAPASMLNHGFWNVSPIALRDWCAANGGEVLDIRFALNGKGTPVVPEKQTGSSSGRPRVPSETVLYGLCRKNVETAISWPLQGQYRR